MSREIAEPFCGRPEVGHDLVRRAVAPPPRDDRPCRGRSSVPVRLTCSGTGKPLHRGSRKPSG